ncbi:YcfA-like protein (plasmid) [Piscirickettsia salmonis]|nr:mRNA interferase family [Piscirickettsia salmonis]QGN96910.1 YcfA-like protein [Piscirickettsia salmonis]QGP48546.1 YcfA-like protein [Piscirickettsia salmonis]
MLSDKLDYNINIVTELMPISGKSVIRQLEKYGWKHTRTSGSHHIMKKQGLPPISVPVHANRDLGRGILKKIEKATGVTFE